MPIRKITSLTLLISFIPLILTSVVLFIVPEGRVAYWSDWRLWGLSKIQWGDIHTTLGFLFLAAGILHFFYNWKPILSYLKNKTRDIKVFTPAFTVALAINMLFLIGTLANVPPFSSILELGGYFKATAAQKYGEPPYGHAELSSITLFAKRTGLDPDIIVSRLTAAQISFKNEKQTLLEIAKANNTTPKAISDLINPPSASPGQQKPFPQEPFPGMGRMVLQDICTTYGLDINTVIDAFAAVSITAAPEKTLKEIAEEHQTSPHTLFEILSGVASKP